MKERRSFYTRFNKTDSIVDSERQEPDSSEKMKQESRAVKISRVNHTKI